ncbi:MAG: helix-turn-helix transcriptional regulator [Clostridiales bacterium]|nr:helix-turn-helix transcriptional regulator [Clostridiales bacterium]
MYILTYFSTFFVQCQVVGVDMKIGNKLKELRLSENLTQEQLSEKVGVSRVNYTRYETDKVRPDYETLIKLADFYDVSLDEIFNRKKY